MWESRVLQRAFERLELHEGKLSRAVLRGGGGGDVTSLPDTWVGNHPGLPGPMPRTPMPRTGPRCPEKFSDLPKYEVFIKPQLILRTLDEAKRKSRIKVRFFVPGLPKS